MKRPLSFSALNKFEMCPRQYAYHYVEGWRTAVTSSNLIFGRCLHEAIAEFVIGHTQGKFVDPVPLFQHKWEKQLSVQEVEFSSTQNSEGLLATGTSLCEQFPAFWEQSGLTALIGPGGEPMVEQKLVMQAATGVKYRGFIDLIAVTEEGEIAIIDFKTSKIQTPDSILLIGEQPTDYQLLVEVNKARLGIERVHKVGFIDLLKRNVPKTKRGKGPEIVGPHLVPARSEKECAERREKIGYLARQIDAGVSFKKPGMAFNTPCSMCDFRNLCLHGSEEGLVRESPSQLKVA